LFDRLCTCLCLTLCLFYTTFKLQNNSLYSLKIERLYIPYLLAFDGELKTLHRVTCGRFLIGRPNSGRKRKNNEQHCPLLRPYASRKRANIDEILISCVWASLRKGNIDDAAYGAAVQTTNDRPVSKTYGGNS